MPWVPLLSAVVGAVIATSSAALLDRFRWRRERHDRLIGVRRALYGDYLECLSQARNAFRSLSRNLEAAASEREQMARDSFAPCYGIRYQMSITASKDVFEAYVGGRVLYDDALSRLRAAMRQDLDADRVSATPARLQR
ncbi:hypothetical protein [Streptomyces echinatus]|uniref:hypothetical protein n=1 Tax=Streptomyces echinatus TaxID=67293 RepID=UPI00380572E1